MVSMQDFRLTSGPGELDGRLCSVPITEVDVSKYCKSNVRVVIKNLFEDNSFYYFSVSNQSS